MVHTSGVSVLRSEGAGGKQRLAQILHHMCFPFAEELQM